MNNELTTQECTIVGVRQHLNLNVPLMALLPSVTQMMELMTADESVNVEVQS